MPDRSAYITDTWTDPTADLRMSTGTLVPTVCRTIAYYADVAASRRLTAAEVEALRGAATAVGHIEINLHHLLPAPRDLA